MDLGRGRRVVGSSGSGLSQAQLRAEVVEAREQDLTACGARSNTATELVLLWFCYVMSICVNFHQFVSPTNISRYLKTSKPFTFDRFKHFGWAEPHFVQLHTISA